MSRQIDLTQPLSDSDRAFLEERGQYRDLIMNEAHLSAAEAPDPMQDKGSDTDGEGEQDVAPVAPNKSAAKPEWVAFAVSQGMDEAEAESMTKDELVTKYTS